MERIHMFLATMADGRRAAAWGEGRRAAKPNLSRLLDGSEVGESLGAC